jgi:ABC-type nitrate/sulfonate/bicarbonate transport system substrate-binding protein
MKVFHWAVLTAVAAALLAGCGEGSGSETTGEAERPQAYRSLSLALDGLSGPETAGIATAYATYQFDEAAFKVFISSPAAPVRTVPYVARRTVDLGVAHGPQVAMAQEEGVPIVAIGSIVPEPTMAMIWLEKSKINDIADLKGKTIGIPGVPFQKDFLAYVLEQAGLKPSEVKVKWSGYDLVPDLISGRVDAIFGGSWNVEGAELEARGLDPVITRAPELGLPPFDELVLIAREDRALKDAELFEEFMAAVEEGTAGAIETPAAAIRGIDMTGAEGVGRKVAEAEVEATLPLLSKTGELDQEQAADLVEWMREQGMLGA